MNNKTTLFEEFENLKGAKFVGINSYVSAKTGEVAKYRINVNFSYENAVNKDIETLENIKVSELESLSNESGIDIELLSTAVLKLKNSLIANKNKETKSNQSKAQNESYVNLTNAIKMHKETFEVMIYGLVDSKTVIIEGEYKTVNSRPLTIAQNKVKKAFKLRTPKYRMFKVNKDNLIGKIAVSGNTYTIL